MVSAVLKTRPFSSRSPRTEASFDAISARSFNAASLKPLATTETHRLRQAVPGHGVAHPPMAVPDMGCQRAILLHLVQLGRLDQRQGVFLRVGDMGLQRGVKFRELHR